VCVRFYRPSLIVPSRHSPNHPVDDNWDAASKNEHHHGHHAALGIYERKQAYAGCHNDAKAHGIKDGELGTALLHYPAV
jgi:hypothetical protein